MVVGFYGGPPPDDALLDALEGTPFVARVRPDLLTRAEAARLAARGLERIELDALSFDDLALASVGRRHRAALVREQLAGLRAIGLQVGVVLAPGLPHTTFDGALRDAAIAAEQVDFVRIHPVLVLDRAGLREPHTDGRYRPLDLGSAVTVCRAMMDVLEPAGVEVIRVGLQPGPDGIGRAVAGPRHPALRQLVEARRTLETLRAALEALRPARDEPGRARGPGLDDARIGAHIVVRCAPADETRTRGPRNQHVRTLRAEFGLASLRITTDPSLERGEMQIERVQGD